MSDRNFDRAQERWDNMLPPDDDPPETPEYLILQICQEWANDPPDWLREKADEYWIERWQENKRGK